MKKIELMRFDNFDYDEPLIKQKLIHRLEQVIRNGTNQIYK